jgi:hypothetical protein
MLGRIYHTLLYYTPVQELALSQWSENAYGISASAPGFYVEGGGIPGWYFAWLMALFAGLAAVQLYFGPLVRTTLVAAFRFNIAVNRYKDNSQVQRQIDNILYVFYFLSFGFVLFLLESHWGITPWGLKGFWLLLLNIGFLVVFFIYRILLLNLVGHLFNRLTLFREFLYHTLTYNKLLGLALLPIGFVMVYTEGWLREVLIWISVSTIILIIGIKIIRGILFSLKRHVFSFYLFLYLCALEMVPILLIYKWVTSIL